MKKICLLSILILSFAGSAFGAAQTVSSNAKIGGTGTGGMAVTGGVDQTAANAASNPLVRMSTGVQGVVNFTAATHIEYAIGTKHVTGSKYFGTSNDSTNIYWLQSVKGDLVPGTFGTGTNNSNFTSAGWTAY